jgi:hypothetical protein
MSWCRAEGACVFSAAGSGASNSVFPFSSVVGVPGDQAGIQAGFSCRLLRPRGVPRVPRWAGVHCSGAGLLTPSPRRRCPAFWWSFGTKSANVSLCSTQHSTAPVCSSGTTDEVNGHAAPPLSSPAPATRPCHACRPDIHTTHVTPYTLAHAQWRARGIRGEPGAPPVVLSCVMLPPQRVCVIVTLVSMPACM